MTLTPQVGSFRLQKPTAEFTLTSQAGGTTTQTHTLNFYVQAENRSGKSLLSDATNLAIASGNKLAWTITATQTGEEIFYYVLSAENTGNPIDAKVLARIKARENDQITARSLPLSIELTTDDHFALAGAVADLTLLPTNPVPGQIVQNLADSTYYFYDPDGTQSGTTFLHYNVPTVGLLSGTNIWFQAPRSSNSYVANTRQSSPVPGSDRPLANIGSDILLAPPIQANANSIAVRYWLANGDVADGQNPVASGTEFTFLAAIQAQDVSSVLDNRVNVQVVGEVDKLTGVLNTGVTGAGSSIVWNSQNTFIVAPFEIERGKALALDVTINSNGIEAIMGQVALNIVEVSAQISQNSTIPQFTGDGVSASGERLVVVPDLLLPGVALVEPTYLINRKTSTPLIDIQPDLADQAVAISGPFNGIPSVYNNSTLVPTSDRLRATISTVGGITQLVEATNGEVTLDGTQSLDVTIAHSIDPATLRGTIRADYPDTLIRNNAQGRFNPTKMYVVFEIVNGASVFSEEVITPTATQTISYTDISALPAFPFAPIDAEQGLFQPSAVSYNAVAGGAIAAGQYKIFVAYFYDTTGNNQITRISHTANGALGIVAGLSNFLSRDNNLAELTDTDAARVQIGAASQVDLDANGALIAANTSAIQTNVTAIAAGITRIVALEADVPANTAFRQLGTGSAVGNLVQVVDVGSGVAGLPALDGSQLTGIDALSEIVFVDGAFTSEVTTPPKHYSVGANGSTTLPSSPADESRISYSDRLDSFATSNATITAGAGDTIDNVAALTLVDNGAALTLIYDAANTNWVVINGLQSVAAGTGDMLRSTYDTNSNGIVDQAEAIAGTTGNFQFFATDGSATPGIYDIGDIVKLALEALTAGNRLSGIAIENFGQVTGTRTDGFAPLYDLATDSVQWGYVDTDPGAILIPISQSLFEAANATLISAYTPDIGTPTFTDAKILSSAATPSNTIQTERAEISVANTGFIIDIGVNYTVLETDWLFTTGQNGAILLRYNNEGNLNYLNLTASGISFQEVVAGVGTQLAMAAFVFNNGTTYRIRVEAIGVSYKILINGAEILSEVNSNNFLASTQFGLGCISGASCIFDNLFLFDVSASVSSGSGGGTGSSSFTSISNHPTLAAYFTDPLAAHWDFNDISGGTVSDNSGNNNDLTISGTVTSEPGILGNAAVTARSGLGKMFNSSYLPFNSGDWSFATWINFVVLPGGGASQQNILGHVQIGAPTGSIFRAIAAAELNTIIGSSSQNSTVPAWAIDTWYHLILVYNSTNFETKFYLGGSLISTLTFVAYPNLTSRGITFGANDHGNAEPNRHSDIRFGDSLIVKAQLTAQEASDLYNGGAVLPYA